MVYQKNETKTLLVLNIHPPCMTEIEILLPRKNFDVAIRETFSNGITGIFGPSGSGKTSLLHAIAGLATPQSGFISIENRILFDSKAKTNIPIEKRNIGYVFQEGRLFPHMSIEKNLRFGMKAGKESIISFEKVVSLLNLTHILSSKPSQVSGGERQRTALGRALLSSPDILLLDEPFSAVDAQLRNQILPYITAIQETTNIPILVISHEIADLLKMTNTLCIIKDGQCMGHGEYYDLLKIPTIADIIGTDTLLNTLTMKIQTINPESGLTILTHRNNDKMIRVGCEKSKLQYSAGDELRIFINADDIALSPTRIDNITIQNQLQGTVISVIDRGTIVLCIIDAGFKLVVEITSESQKRLEIEEGQEIWCLFKSVAIDVAG